FRRLWNERRQQTQESHRYSRGFFFGLADGFREKLESERQLICRQLDVDHNIAPGEVTKQAETGLSVIQSKLDKAYKDYYGNTLHDMAPPATVRGRSAFEAGVGLGRNLEIPEFH